jgi:hypothetical protein
MFLNHAHCYYSKHWDRTASNTTSFASAAPIAESQSTPLRWLTKAVSFTVNRATAGNTDRAGMDLAVELRS